MNNKRLDYLDMAKGIGMLLVLMGHLQGEQIYQLSPYFHPWCVFIFSFHMPMFFIISGILMAIKNDDTKSFKEIAVKRFKGIMIPYYWFSLFYLLVVVYALINGTIAIQTLLINVWYVISGYGMNVLWFLPALYLGELLFVYLKQRLKSDKSFVITVIVLFVITYIFAYLLTLPSTEAVIYKRFREIVTVLLRPVLVCSFICLGYYIHKLLEKEGKLGDIFLRPQLVNGKLTIKYRFMYIVLGIALLVVCAAFAPVNNGIDVRTMVLRNIFFFLLCCVSGSYGLIIMCKGLPRLRLVSYWGVGSLIFMATHNSETVLYYAMNLSMYVNQYLTRARGYICYAIIVIVITTYSTIMIFLIRRFVPFIIGKPFPKKLTKQK